MLNIEEFIGKFVNGVTLEICRGQKVTRPRVRPVDKFSSSVRVEFPRKLRELFPIGTRYMATVKVCQNIMLMVAQSVSLI
jgi:hypothetical protein